MKPKQTETFEGKFLRQDKSLDEFIADALAKARKELLDGLVGEVRKIKVNTNNQDYPKNCGCDGECFGACQQSRDYGNNQALKAVLNLINKQ